MYILKYHKITLKHRFYLNIWEVIKLLEDEVWIENNGYNISNKGRVTKINSEKLQKMSVNSHGYVCANVKFEDGFYAKSVHRAVAYAFIGKPEEGQEVNHIDGNKENNCVDNLEWCTKKENQQHEAKVLNKRGGERNYKSTLTEKEVLEIYELCKEGKMLYTDIAKMYDVFPQTISNITGGISWKYLNLEIIRLVRGTHGKGRPYRKKIINNQIK